MIILSTLGFIVCVVLIVLSIFVFVKKFIRIGKISTGLIMAVKMSEDITLIIDDRKLDK